MDIIGSILNHGTEAVLEYRRMNAIETDERVPEVFLGGRIALGVHRDTGLNAHVERYYTTIATELGRQRDAELMSSLGGWRADVALYEAGSQEQSWNLRSMRRVVVTRWSAVT